MTKPMREAKIAAHLKKMVKIAGGEIRKVRWEGRNNAPDYVVMLPNGYILWVETKATKGVVSPAQKREHKRMTDLGQTVFVPKSIEEINTVIGIYTNG